MNNNIISKSRQLGRTIDPKDFIQIIFTPNSRSEYYKYFLNKIKGNKD